MQHLNPLFSHQGSLKHQFGGSHQLAHQGQQGKHSEGHQVGPHIMDHVAAYLVNFYSGKLNLKEVKKIANEARFKWFDIGIELDFDLDILTVSHCHYIPFSFRSLNFCCS